MISSNSVIADTNSRPLQPGKDSMLPVYPMISDRHSQDGSLIIGKASVPDLLAENSYSDNPSGPSSTEEAVFPPTYAALPTTKLEEEPNPFEQSFESLEKSKIQLRKHNKAQLMETSYASNQNEWDSKSESIILPPSMLSRPTKTNTMVYGSTASTFNNASILINQMTYTGSQQKRMRQPSATNSCCSEDSSFIISTPSKPTNKKSRKPKKSSMEQPEDEEKRKNFLERNRIAALKCRQRKKQWLQNLQTKVECLGADNEQFQMQANALRDEVIRLKTLLMIHKDCPINPSDVQAALSRPIPGIFDPSNSPHSSLLRSTTAPSMSPPPFSSSNDRNTLV
ncbi:hypothetical protein [Parasitella parasitica]|uniref:BZIP domain-containing protein n=1 Tax=Parasitella parasitica TaxID=35722 RepID=A0A0B7N5M0_9FUNG|nr:hypothetical protein [Parasitella parasitica]